MTKTKSFIQEDLEWLESKIASIKQYVDSNPLEGMVDRVIQIGTGRGMKDQVTATVEQQIKSVRDSLKDLPPLLEAVEKLREKNQATEIQIKGKQEMPGMMRKKFEGQS